jgi:hypothetical protein
MLSSFAPGNPAGTFLTPGQQFHSTGQPDALPESLVVARLVRDRLGLLHVTMRTDSGREISAFAEQVELAVSEGHLVPVDPVAQATFC